MESVLYLLLHRNSFRLCSTTESILGKFSAEHAVHYQLEALKNNDQPRQDYGIEVMYRFAGLFRRGFHHSTYRVLLGHKERKIVSTLFVEENKYKQRVWFRGSRPEEEEIFQFTMVQASVTPATTLGWKSSRTSYENSNQNASSMTRSSENWTGSKPGSAKNKATEPVSEPKRNRLQGCNLPVFLKQ
ncbi:hypothetical protein VNO80_10263 [Phaseolus coccineus]|uniref:Uncharacterized protein n=1 Tax=Phaseolus coccineus TaxID=3886 RepID=A0AAN9REH8_PHACN